VLAELESVAAAVADGIAGLDDPGAPGRRVGQYAADVVADDIAVAALLDAGFGVVSEESGAHGDDRPVVVVVDPLDGSENAVRGLGPHGVSLCAVGASGLLAAHVLDLGTKTAYAAIRGEGAVRDGRPIHTSGRRDLAGAAVAVSGHPPGPLAGCTRGWGAAALELCAVAEGTFDAFVQWGADHHGCWDYLAGTLICLEAGAWAEDVRGRDLTAVGPDVRRAPLVAATVELRRALRDRMAELATGDPERPAPGARAGC
jgi:fructose-1,6-bisphosphatase/inositol monophosphatase family enzyme